MKTQEQLDAERNEMAKIRERVSAWINGGAPASHNQWDYMRSVRFNEAAKKANQFLASKRPMIKKSREVYEDLRSYYEG